MDALWPAAVAVLMTAITGAGCGTPSRTPPQSAAPPAAPTLARVPTLRVGLPAASRGNLLFLCDAPPSAPRIGSAAYAVDSLDASGRRWLRIPQDTPDSAGALAPDTLVVRAFDDPTDEEIAFERGELDAAVFWPGELSARMRSDARFRNPEWGVRSRGVLVCIAGAGDTLGAPRGDMEGLNREAFGGDLLAWSTLEPGPGEGPPARYTVDRTVPGGAHLERILARLARPGGTRTLKLLYLDQPVAAGDAASAAWRLPGLTPLFAIRCPVLAAPAALNGVRAIGTHAFVELAPCAGGIRR
jgi:hypothetical protein